MDARQTAQGPQLDDIIPKICPWTGKAELWRQLCSSNETHTIHVKPYLSNKYQLKKHQWEEKKRWPITNDSRGSNSRSQTHSSLDPSNLDRRPFCFEKNISHSPRHMHAWLVVHGGQRGQTWMVLFVWSFKLRQLRVVSGYRRSMGYLRVGCRAGVFSHFVTLPCSYPVGDQ